MTGNIQYIPNKPYIPIGNVKKANRDAINSARNEKANAFKEFLDENIAGVKFSNHAKERLRDRNIELSPQQLGRISKAVDKAAGKGAKDSLLLIDDMAAVVSIKNKTVVTVVDNANLKNNVFTNIDSAVIA